MTDPRAYPERPILATSAAVIRDGRVLLVCRARPPMHGLFTFPGGVVEAGETVLEALKREVLEETSLVVEPVELAGFRDIVMRDADNRISRHFVIMAFAARWISGEPVLNEELGEFRWLLPSEVAGVPTTEGLEPIVHTAFRRMAEAG